jgi:hypothetical protein
LTREDTEKLLTTTSEAQAFIRRACGSDEFINGQERFCLWIPDESRAIAMQIPLIADRVERVRLLRLASTRPATHKLADVPHRFGEVRHIESNSIIVPKVSSERRTYIPIGFLDQETVITDLAFAIYDAEAWMFAVLTSRMHNVWVRTVSGRLRTDIRYSAGLCYNTFPFPKITEEQRETLCSHVFDVISEREKHSERTIAQLYHPEAMPSGLLQAHAHLDTAIEQCYRPRPFLSDQERLAYLFSLYEQMQNHSS